MVEVLEVSKNGYYKLKKPLGKQDPEETALMELIVSIYIEHRGRSCESKLAANIKR